MKKVRNNTFETNSSSSHSFILETKRNNISFRVEDLLGDIFDPAILIKYKEGVPNYSYGNYDEGFSIKCDTLEKKLALCILYAYKDRVLLAKLANRIHDFEQIIGCKINLDLELISSQIDEICSIEDANFKEDDLDEWLRIIQDDNITIFNVYSKDW